MDAVNLKLITPEKITIREKPTDRTFRVLEQLHKPITPEAINTVETWFIETEYYLDQYLTASVLEFTVLNHIQRSKYFKHFGLKNSEIRLFNCLQKCRLLLTGKTSSLSELTMRLPKFVLADYARDEVLFHQSSFHGLEILTFWQTLQQIVLDYIPRFKDFVFLTILGSLLLWSPFFLELIIGLFVGYCFSSFMEYYVHQNIGHAGPKMKRFFKRFGNVGRDMAHFSLEHSIHHGSVHVNYANPFAPNKLESALDFVHQVKNRQKIDELIFKRGGEKLVNLITTSQYGLRSSKMWRTHLFFLPISLLSLMLIEGLFSQHTSLIFSFGFLIISTFWITASSVYHPCLHYTENKINNKVHFFLRWFLKTRFSRFIAHSHRMHHAHGGEVNQNLNIGFDYFFAWAPITTTELIDLKNRKTIY